MLHRFLTIGIALLAVCCSPLPAQTAASNAATTNESGVTYYMGPVARVGQGRIRTWVSTDTAGNPLALGVSFTPGLLNELPTTDAEYQLLLPAQAAPTGFNHFALNWNPMGHFPTQIYGVPHFDFHFYTITPTVRNQITAAGPNTALVRKTPPAGAVPPNYMYAEGGDVAHMGAHWVNRNAPELHGQPFTQTLIYGFYNGKMAFIEPMVALSYLQTRPYVASSMPVPTIYPSRAYYPTGYKVAFDQSTGQYTVALYGMRLR